MSRRRSLLLHQRGPDVLRVLLLLVVAALIAVLTLDWSRAPIDTLEVGAVAPRTVKAPYPFPYLDVAARERGEEHARTSVPSVFVAQLDLLEQQQARVHAAFDASRAYVASIPVPDTLEDEPSPEPAELPDDVRSELIRVFRAALGVHVPESAVLALHDTGFSPEAESLAVELIERAMRGYVIASREVLPTGHDVLQVLELRGSDREERTLRDLALVRTPEEARQQVSIALIELSPGTGAWVDAAATVARASVRPNLTYDPIETEDRRSRAASEVPVSLVTVPKGATLFLEGDALTDLDIHKYRAMQAARPEQGLWVEFLAVFLFLQLLLVTTYAFGKNYLQGFSARIKDLAAVGVMLVVTAVLTRLVVASAPQIAPLLGGEAQASSIWYVVPVAGAVMLVRLVVGLSWSMLFALVASAVAGLMMRLEALPVVFFLLSGLVAAGSVEHTRERLAVVRAGLFVGVVNATTVLLMHFLQLYLSEPGVDMATTMRPVWSMAFAFLGGLLLVPMVLGLVPAFESVGFVTDYRLMELASLNHPLLRQLMLRAPGSYHHSVLVGSLAEAACQAVDGNALHARVAAYFHDVGKSLKPQYFIENQGGAANPHDSLGPHASARIIISHVTDGLRLAHEHNLPRPIRDNIAMHHGTGLLKYFYTQALAAADDPSTVRMGDFQYPGPKPDTREAGILMLADKVEAATRTIRRPTEEAFRAMILKIVNSVMADGQFESCPLTFKEIHTVVDTFVEVLRGVYHQRIEYPETAEISNAGEAGPGGASRVPPVPGNAVITLEITGSIPTATTPLQTADQLTLADDESTDYEALEHLPGADPS